MDQMYDTASSRSQVEAERLLAAIETLAPEIKARAEEIEAGRRIPLDLIGKLKSLGAFRLFVPRRHGGLELDLQSGLDLITAVSRIEGSVGWTMMIASGGQMIMPALPETTYADLYSNGPDLIVAGSAQPLGRAEMVRGGWRVSGCWPFASGCLHADIIVGLCVMTENGEPIRTEAGTPLTRFAVLPAREWEIEDTWHVSGLKGTGSNHVVLRDAMVPDSHFAQFPGSAPCIPGPLYRSPFAVLPLLHASMSVGVAEAALQDIVALATSGRQQLRASQPMRDSELFQDGLARAQANLRAAQHFHRTQTEAIWRQLHAGPPDGAQVLETIQACLWIAATCVQVAQACFVLGGGASVYENSPLSRRLRDLQAAAQHGIAQPRHYASTARPLLGLPLPPQ